MSARDTSERLAELQSALPVLLNGIESLSVYPALGDDGKPRMVFEYTLDGDAALEAFRCVFDGNEDAQKVNGTTVGQYGMWGLTRSVCKLCRHLRAQEEASK